MSVEQRGGAPLRREITITPEAKKFLNNTPSNKYIEVVFEMAAPHKTDLAGLNTRSEKLLALEQDAEKNFSGITQVLEQVQEVDDELTYEPAYLNDSIYILAPKGLINVLADREDVRVVDRPAKLVLLGRKK